MLCPLLAWFFEIDLIGCPIIQGLVDLFSVVELEALVQLAAYLRYRAVIREIDLLDRPEMLSETLPRPFMLIRMPARSRQFVNSGELNCTL